MEKVTARDAIKIAKEYYQFATGNYTLPLNLEEFEIDRDKKKWILTFSYYEDSDFYINNINKTKVFKVFEIDIESGDVLSMKNPEH